MKRWLVVILILSALALLISCSDSPTGQSITDTKQAQVSITKYSYDPLILTIKKNTTVTWTNKDSEQHTITLLGVFDSGTLGRRHQFSYTFTEPGTYTYTDLFYQNERVGKVIVK